MSWKDKKVTVVHVVIRGRGRGRDIVVEGRGRRLVNRSILEGLFNLPDIQEVESGKLFN